MATPLCPYFGVCGGCSLQDVDYSLQVDGKRTKLADTLGLDKVSASVGSEYFYRSRMDFSFYPGGLGFRERGRWDRHFDVERCVISNGGVNKVLAEVREFFRDVDAFDVRAHTGSFRHVVIRAPSGGSSVSLILNKESKRLPEAVERIREFALVTSADTVMASYLKPETEASLCDDYMTVKGSQMLSEVYSGREFMFHAQGFFQNNPQVSQMMHEHVSGILGGYETKNAHMLDLYGGVGTFGIINADLFEGVSVVENDVKSIMAAQENIIRNNVANVKAVPYDASKLKSLDFPRPLFVVTDPPRRGMHPKTVERINELKPEAVVYISCNRGNLANDIPKFIGYEVKSAALFDMFPQTPHIEAVVELNRRGGQ